jgi:general secretion pathway protein J
MISQRRRVRRHHRQSGFTLLELLVALVVLGFLMVGLAEGVRAGLDLRGAQTRRLDRTADLDASMRLLRNLISDLPVVPGGNRLIATEAGAGIKGEPDRLSFVGELPTGIGTTRLADMTLYVDHARLTLAWQPHRHVRLPGPPAPPIRTVLLDGVEKLRLAYWDPPAPGQPAAWSREWQAPVAPELIRIGLVFAANDPRRWPDLIARSRP